MASPEMMQMKTNMVQELIDAGEVDLAAAVIRLPNEHLGFQLKLASEQLVKFWRGVVQPGPSASAGPPVTGGSIQGVPQTEGVAKKLYKTERLAFSQQLLYTALKYGAVLIKAPPQSGKTSALQLAAAQLPWLESLEECEELEISILWVSMLGPGETLDEALEQQLGIKGGWKCLDDSPPSSSAGDNLRPCPRRKVTILFIDEVQKLFHKRHQAFWDGMKLLAQRRHRHMCVVMAAAYGLAPSGCNSLPARLGPAGVSNEEDKMDAELSQEAAAAAVRDEAAQAAAAQVQALDQGASPITTPFKLQDKQVVTVVPPAHLEDYFPASREAPMVLTLTMKEFEELHTEWEKAFGLKLGNHVLRYIYDFAGGQAGSVCIILDFLQAKLVNEAKQGDVNIIASYKLTSPGMLQACSTSRSIAHISTMSPHEQRVVLQLLNDGSLDFANLSEELKAPLHKLYAEGMVVPDERQPGGRMFRFTSPMHELVAAHGAYFDTQNIKDIKTLVKLMLQRLDPLVLSMSHGRATQTNRPLEGVYHHEVYRTISGLLPIDGTGMKAVLSTFVGQLFGVDGFLDLYVSEPWCWGFELLRDGRGLTEHTNRFMPGGVYHKMKDRGQLKHIVVLDMRAENMGAPKTYQSPDADMFVIRACFTQKYQSVWVHGLEKDAFELKVCGRQGVTSSCSSVEMSIRS